MASNDETTTRFRADISELRAAMQEARRHVRLANSEFQAATSGMESWATNADGLSARIRQLNTVLNSERTVLSNLERQHELTVQQYGENSRAAEELEIRINRQRATIARTERELQNYENSLDELANESSDTAQALRESDDAMEDIGDNSNALSSKLGNLAKTGFAAVGAAAAGMVAAFLASAESTREYREDIGKLKTAFETAGYGAETATETYKSFFSVLGEEDRSVEAVNHLAAMRLEQEQLAQWTDICAGVWGTFGDSLPIEGLTEASNETAKVGKVTGPLADALNWAGISEDKFNDALTACNDEQERATLITETLNHIYADAAENYKENNAAVIEAQRAQSELTDAMASVGAVAEPVMTSLKLLGAEMLNGMLPAIETLGEAFNGLLNGEVNSGEQVGNAIGDVVNFVIDKISTMLPQVLNAGVNLILSVAQGITQAIPQLLSAILQMLPSIIQTIGTMLPQLVSSVINGLYQIIDAIILNAPALLTAAVQFFTGLVQALPEIISDLMEQIDALVADLGYTLIEYIPQFLEAVMQFWGALVDALPQIIESLTTYLPIIVDTVVQTIVQGVPLLLDAALTLFMAIVDALPVIIEALVDALPEIIDTVLETLLDAIPDLLDAAIEFLTAIIEAIPIIIDELVPVIPDIVETVVDILIDNIPLLLKTAFTLFMAIVEAIPDIVIELGKAVPKIIVAILEGLASLDRKLSDLLGDAFDSFVEWGSDLIRKGKEVATDLLDTIVDNIKDLPDEMMSIGKNVVEGLWNGIKDMTSWVKKKIQGFSDDVLDGIKDFFGIHSPSKVMKEEVGENLAAGVVEGYGDGMKQATAETSKYNEKFFDSLKTDMTEGQQKLAEESAKAAEKSAKEAEKAAAKQAKLAEQAEKNRLKLFEMAQKEAKKIADQYQKATDEAFEAQVEAEKEHIKTLADDLTAITDQYEKTLTGIQSKIQSFQNNVTKSFADCLEFTKTDDDIIIGVEDTGKITKATDELEKYLARVDELRKRGVSDTLINQLATMSVEEGAAVAEYYASMTDTQLKALEEQWAKYNETSRKLAEELYSDELTAATDGYFAAVQERLASENETMKAAGLTYVKSMIDAFDITDPAAMEQVDRLTQSVDDILKTAEESTLPTASEIGKNLTDGIVEGFTNQMQASKAAIKKSCDDLTKTVKDSFDIHSPSKLFRNEVGRRLSEGLALGITDKAKDAINAARSMGDQIKASVSGINSDFASGNAGLASNSVVHNYNFTQTNNSPKALSRLEIYRQTKNQIAMLKGV